MDCCSISFKAEKNSNNIVNIPSCFLIKFFWAIFPFCALQLAVACCTEKKELWNMKIQKTSIFLLMYIGNNFDSKRKVRGNLRINHLIKSLLSSSWSVKGNAVCCSYIHLYVDTLNLILVFSMICRYWEWWRN